MLPEHLRYPVYIVDDSAVQRNHAANLCRELGMTQITQAHDGLEALLALKNGQVTADLMLLDLEMPGLDGIALLQELQRLKLALRVIVMSTREASLLATLEHLHQDAGVKVLAALQKPINVEQLRAALLTQDSPPASTTALPAFAPAELETAFGRNEIQLLYRPCIRLGSGLIQSVIVTPCWQHDQFGQLCSEELLQHIPPRLDDETLYRQLLDDALLRAQHWLQRGLKLSVQVSLPHRLLEQRMSAKLLEQRLLQFGLQPGMLVIKIADWDGARDSASIAANLGQLRLMGFGIAIADRGNGFAWLEQLGSIPFNEFHLDAGFVQRASERELTRIILESMIQLAHRLELKTVAPGLDKAETWQLLQGLGCDFATGPLISGLLGGEDVIGWIRENSERLRQQARQALPAHPGT
ncbi:EAL domain-containing response regulator [Chitinilyticum litopenaei]|uniref:EAL domain-containing response regulator n=1 Tax=Chitinilyticum litopenaei TaxID=1121276 RepID=UPI0004133BE2|nr:EAL domain-containing protein [Chitinilyticum litopenaei]